MNNISLLFLNDSSRKELDSQIIIDFKLKKIFNEKTISIIKKECCVEEIIARQEIFKELNDETSNFGNAILVFRNSLLNFKNTLEIYQKSNEFERFFCFDKLISSYIDIIKKGVEINLESELIYRFSKYFQNLYDNLNFIIEIEEKYSSAINSFRHINITYNYNYSLISKSNPDNDVKNDYFSSLKNMSNLIGYSFPQKQTNWGSLPNAIYELLKKQYGNIFLSLESIIQDALPLFDFNLISLVDEINFYLTVNSLLEKSATKKIPFCFPSFSDDTPFICEDIYDITMIDDNSEIVPNDFSVTKPDHCFFVVGVNGGGKTTFLRSIGVNLILFSCGCPVFANSAYIKPNFRIHTHFSQNEIISQGRLDAEISRLENVVLDCKRNDWVFLNETFSSTNDNKGTELALKYMDFFNDHGINCIYATHLTGIHTGKFDILQTVVDEAKNPVFKIIKSESKITEFCSKILKKYRLDNQSLVTR